jgi:hypothetical protein
MFKNTMIYFAGVVTGCALSYLYWRKYKGEYERQYEHYKAFVKIGYIATQTLEDLANIRKKAKELIV